MLRDVLTSAEGQENAMFGLGFAWTLKKNHDSAVKLVRIVLVIINYHITHQV